MNIKKLDNYSVEDIELELFIQALYLQYGHDFRNYSRAHLKRRINYRISSTEGVNTISQLQDRILHSREFFNKIIGDFSINVTEMFRDPDFYRSFRENVVPVLRTYPFLKIWHAGCSTGQEVYSMAILLKEEGLLERTQIYATDFNESVLKIAKEGIYSIDDIRSYTDNYNKSGGKESFSDYFTAKYDFVKFKDILRKKIVFSTHNLATDGVFGEMNVIICRNVLIYFDKQLQNRALNLFSESLVRGGILGLGSKETISYSSIEEKFEVLSQDEKIYKKKYT